MNVSKRLNHSSMILRVLMYLGAATTIMILLFVVGYILVKGIPHLSLSLFSWNYNSENVSLMPALINTLEMIGYSLVMAIPVGIGSAIYLAEYSNPRHKITSVIRITTETLSGIPSIVYGLFGSLFFVNWLHWRLSILAGAATLAIMILPLIMRTTEEALMAVPLSYREASYGLGAGKLRTIFAVILPSALPGILSGIILSIGRIIGESAALIYTAGTLTKAASSPMSSGRTLAVHMYALASEGLHLNETYATAVVLIILVLIINGLSELVVKSLGRKTK